MRGKLERGFKGKYPHLQKQELGFIQLFFYVNLLLLASALTVLALDFFDFFSGNFYPSTLSFIGIFILILFFLLEGKKNAALNALLFIPVPAYFLMISTRYAIFPPQSSFNYEIYLFSAAFVFLLILSEKPFQILAYLLVT
ncbi:MAG: hypothetical protein WCO84_07115, partial [bacterium]